jgi:hypothetical protein
LRGTTAEPHSIRSALFDIADPPETLEHLFIYGRFNLTSSESATAFIGY